ncbi:MAG TPA: gamma-glutamyl-gamma-aminobutyrate hydrolase family protein [Alphaproteobacteria bacterium]|nr:gamma-glutamyl-gamma-aminobutyrate hydrolase family protein [Alphaproteobacteria bacterium]USO06541.1 MAG: gamma-glutamyl-gamma-aminobutyrate hydrolase family protein [Rhodospirillales bacterium]HOO81958.1 gamma-glutamyl-gamma-aminobutyrate hydrolase family protein [Alphaproteobacteria bacterium]
MNAHKNIKPDNHVRVGILAERNENGEVSICERWARPFEKAGMNVEYIPVGAENIDEILDRIHGLLLPGGDSNINPYFYDPGQLNDHLSIAQQRDIARDRTAIALAQKAYALNIPTLGICRGMQEMLVAFGGALETLNTQINHAQGYNAVLADGTRCFETMDRPVHEIEIVPGGLLDSIYDKKNFFVNSIHMQGITHEFWQHDRNKDLREVFRVEAYAPDGVIEAISTHREHEKRFFVGLQAHFELPGALHISIFTPFRREIRDYAANKS